MKTNHTFLRLKWRNAATMSKELQHTLAKLREESASRTPFEVLGVSSTIDEVVVLVAQEA